MISFADLLKKTLPIAIVLCVNPPTPAQEDRAPENVYQGELVRYPGPWAFEIPRAGIILVTDQELVDLSEDPDKELNLSTGFHERKESLRQICERAQQAGMRTLMLAFDQFFAQYRPGLGDEPRQLTPDKPEYIERIAKIGKFAQGYGLGLELSLVTPLEIGPAYCEETGESGVWMQYRKGLRDPQSGAFSVQMWRQKKWASNKGTVDLEDAGVRVFAFSESEVGGSPYRVVDPAAMVEISELAQVESLGGGSSRLERIRVHGKGREDIGPLSRVLVVQLYRTPEMDYFSPKAEPYLKNLVNRYADTGVQINALYSDEIHIQQDWVYSNHHDNGELTVRFVSDGLIDRFAEEFGEEYRDFAKYLIYFTYGQEDFASNLSAKQGIMHVFGASPEEIRRTALFRARYYRLLQDGVTDLFVKAKRYAEQRMGQRLEARAHATWAESPTIDFWTTGQDKLQRNQYEYTSNFVWSNTVHQAAAACSDYFAWGDFLTGNGNDHAEGGWIDRNYYALALACSTGILNEVPYSYAAHWGMPGEISNRRSDLNNAFGTNGSPLYGLVQDLEHREVEVLMLYPFDLVAVEERFGSWMNQYGYADQVTAPKLLERGKVVPGGLEMAGRKYTTLVATFEPFPSTSLLTLMGEFVAFGGRLIWSGPPPVLTSEGGDALQDWQRLFGVDYTPEVNEGRLVPGREVVFEGALSAVTPQIVLTHFLVDRAYPVAPRQGTLPVARMKGEVVGTLRNLEGGGTATFLGYRPRDDQSASLGYETRNWFEVLDTLGAYPPSGQFDSTNDNTEHLSRTTDYLCCRFPNGAVGIARHFFDYEEGWSGGFARKPEQDQAYMAAHPLPSDEILLDGYRVDGHEVSFVGNGSMIFRLDEANRLIGFAGKNCHRIVIDGATTTFADNPVPLVGWGPVSEERQVEGGAILQAQIHGTGEVRIPFPNAPLDIEVVTQGGTPGSRGNPVAAEVREGFLILQVDAASSGRWLYAIPRHRSKS